MKSTTENDRESWAEKRMLVFITACFQSLYLNLHACKRELNMNFFPDWNLIRTHVNSPKKWKQNLYNTNIKISQTKESIATFQILISLHCFVFKSFHYVLFKTQAAALYQHIKIEAEAEMASKTTNLMSRLAEKIFKIDEVYT